MVKKINVYVLFAVVALLLLVMCGCLCIIADERITEVGYIIAVIGVYSVFWSVVLTREIYYAVYISKLQTLCNEKNAGRLILEVILLFTVYEFYWVQKTEKRIREEAARHKVQMSGGSLAPMLIQGVIYILVNGFNIASKHGEITIEAYMWVYIISIVLYMVYFFLISRDLNLLIDGYHKSSEQRNGNLLPHQDNYTSEKHLDMTQTDILEKDAEPTTIEELYEARHYLVCRSGIYQGFQFPLAGEDFMMLGRDAQTAHIVITGDKKVSRLQCQIRFNSENGHFEIVDCSSVGTYINGNMIPKGQIVFGKTGDTIRLGESENIFELQ